MSKQLSTLLRHGELLPEEDGAIEFWRLEDDLRNKFEHSQFWSDDAWKSKMARGGGNKKRFQFCTDPSGQEILYLRALQGHSGRNPIDPTLQNNVLIPNNFFEYIYHIGCAVSLQSITNSGFIAERTNSSRERQTVFFTAVNPMSKDHRDPQELDLTKPRLASYKLKWKRHQDTVYWVDFQLSQRKGLKFYQTRSNAIIRYDTLPACCISKVVVMKSEEIIYQKVFVSHRPPPKNSCKDDWMRDLDSEVAGSSKNNQRIQPKPNYQVRRDSYVGKSPQRKSRNVLCLIARMSQTQQVRWDPYVDKNPQSVVCWHLHILKKITQERWDPYWWRSTKLISEYQDRHMQLWKKQNISEFKSLWKRSKVIFIEKHFMPTCSRITSTTHSAKIRRRWSANWVMWSYSSCAKLDQKYTVLTVFFIGIKEFCTALADNAWLTANPKESLTN